MTNRKNYNSILFLTVYLGLVLVGATPQVLAHAATNSFFDLRNEIEFKDDLDNKPDDSCEALKAITNESDNQFVDDYVKLVLFSLEKNRNADRFDIVRVVQNDVFRSLRDELSANLYQLKSNKDGVSFSLNITSSSTDKSATPFVQYFRQSLSFQRCKTQDLPEKTVYGHTQVVSLSNQIFIVTRLPRGSIDSLLK